MEWIKITMDTGEKILCSFNAVLDDGEPGSRGPPSKTAICNQGTSCGCLMVAKKRPNASSNSHFQLYSTASTYIYKENIKHNAKHIYGQLGIAR